MACCFMFFYKHSCCCRLCRIGYQFMKQIKFYLLVFTNVLIFSSTVFSAETIVFSCNLSDSPEYKWVPRYLNSVDEDTTTDEVDELL